MMETMSLGYPSPLLDPIWLGEILYKTFST